MWALVLLAVLVTSCATPPSAGYSVTQNELHRSGRFSLNVQKADGSREAVQGGFVWSDNGESLQLDLTNPVGSTMARVLVNPDMAVLERSNGQRELAYTPDHLVEQVLGSPIPVSGLRSWLHGNTGKPDASNVENDKDGNLAYFEQHGWRVQLSRYDSLGPTLIRLNRHGHQGEISVRLAISGS